MQKKDNMLKYLERFEPMTFKMICLQPENRNSAHQLSIPLWVVWTNFCKFYFQLSSSTFGLLSLLSIVRWGVKGILTKHLVASKDQKHTEQFQAVYHKLNIALKRSEFRKLFANYEKMYFLNYRFWSKIVLAIKKLTFIL